MGGYGGYCPSRKPARAGGRSDTQRAGPGDIMIIMIIMIIIIIYKIIIIIIIINGDNNNNDNNIDNSNNNDRIHMFEEFQIEKIK